MLFLVALLFIGFFSSACAAKPNRGFISLRDYDFVGEDQALMGELARRLAPLRQPVNVSDLDARPRPPRRRPPDFQPQPDVLQLDLGLDEPVNVSMDYAEMFNASELEFEDELVAPNSSATADPKDRDFRRYHALHYYQRYRPVKYIYPDSLQTNRKILDLMRQSIYSAHNKIQELNPTVKKYEIDIRFRMAYIFRKLDEWKKDIRTNYLAQIQFQRPLWRAKKIIWYYEHCLRLNADITYSIEHLIYMHAEYMRMMAELMSGD